jgi:hypothetical protein
VVPQLPEVQPVEQTGARDRSKKARTKSRRR